MSQSSIVVLLFLFCVFLGLLAYIHRAGLYLQFLRVSRGNRPAGMNAGAKHSLYWRNDWKGDGRASYVCMFVCMYIQLPSGYIRATGH